jgi:hypothetical protein
MSLNEISRSWNWNTYLRTKYCIPFFRFFNLWRRPYTYRYTYTYRYQYSVSIFETANPILSERPCNLRRKPAVYESDFTVYLSVYWTLFLNTEQFQSNRDLLESCWLPMACLHKVFRQLKQYWHVVTTNLSKFSEGFQIIMALQLRYKFYKVYVGFCKLLD